MSEKQSNPKDLVKKVAPTSDAGKVIAQTLIKGSSLPPTTGKETKKKEGQDDNDDTAVEEDFDEDSNDEDMEALDYVIVEPQPEGSSNFIIDTVFGDITGYSAGKQFAFGGACGWAAGYLGAKIGKLAAFVVGGCLLLLQVAQYNGFISVDWFKVKHALTHAQAKVIRSMMRHKELATEQSKTFFGENMFLATGFAAGALISLLM